jgi:hypothetical protein
MLRKGGWTDLSQNRIAGAIALPRPGWNYIPRAARALTRLLPLPMPAKRKAVYESIPGFLSAARFTDSPWHLISGESVVFQSPERGGREGEPRLAHAPGSPFPLTDARDRPRSGEVIPALPWKKGEPP